MKKFIKSLYDAIPFKRELFSFLKIFWKPPVSVYKHLHFIGTLTIKINNKAKFKIRHYGYELENEIFWNGLTGGWEKESFKLWIKLCEDADVIFDIGANTGVYSLIAKAVNPASEVFAFEPVKRIVKKLQDNITLNGFDIITVEKAVSNRVGKAIIYDTQQEHIYSVTVNKHYFTPDVKLKEVEIETVTLNSFIRDNNIKKVDLLKIDVETHEPEVLEGFSEYITRFRPSMLIEILNNEVGEQVEKLVQGCGYLYFNIDEKSGVRRVEKIETSDYYNYLLCSEETAVELGLFSRGFGD